MNKFNWRQWFKFLKEIKSEATPLKLVLIANKLPDDAFWADLSSRCFVSTLNQALQDKKGLQQADLAVICGSYAELINEAVPKLINTIQANNVKYLIVVTDTFTESEAAIKLNELSVNLKTSENLIAFKADAKNMAQKLIDLAGQKLVGLALIAPFLRDQIADKLIMTTALQNGSIGLIGLLPGSDMPVLTANQIKLVLKIAAVYGEKLTWGRLVEMFFVTNGGFFFRYIARQIVGLIPVGGLFIKGSIAYSGTQAVGHIAKAYFKSLKQTQNSDSD